MKLKEIEGFLQNHIEGFFNRKFSSDLEPVEVIAALEKEISRQGSSKALFDLPNCYELTIAEEDYHRICSQRIIDSFYLAVKRQIIRQNLLMTRQLKILCRPNSQQLKGTYQLNSCYTNSHESNADDLTSNTIVLDNRKIKENLSQTKHKSRLAVLKVLKGSDKNTSLELSERRIYLGRLAKNDFILTDSNVSRIHACITYENHRHVISDCNSTNGTIVNGERISSKILSNFDKITIGETMLSYEVI